MRVNVNLASRKYEDVRRFFVVWGVSLAVLGVLTVALAVTAYVKRSNAKHAAVAARALEQKVGVLQKQLNDLKAFEELPENREVTQQKQYWNGEISKRLFSWTLLFNELQKIMPERAYVNSVQPQLTADNRLKLKVTVIGERHEDGLKLIERMEGSRKFHSPRPVSEDFRKGQKGEPPGYVFEIETYYTPAAQESTKSANKEGA